MDERENNRMAQGLMAIAALFAGLAVGGGAFASHALRGNLAPRALEIFETGIRYQMYHALALLLVALLIHQAEVVPPTLPYAGYAFIAGMVIFSGSLYALSLSDVKWLGAITPLGGLLFLVGWGCLAISAMQYK
jgi:uncharacterized membrane protein YgdD (TMEM256/DUF423 family)